MIKKKSYVATFADCAAVALALMSPKPLVWGVVWDTGSQWFDAVIENGKYRARKVKTWIEYEEETGISHAWVVDAPNCTLPDIYITLEAAQSAAQAHHEAAHWANTHIGDLIRGVK
jgi:hypothetical protein